MNESEETTEEPTSNYEEQGTADAEMVRYERPPILPSADEFAFVFQMAEALSRSQLVPSSARGKAADVAIILLAARDMGIPLTQALAKLNVIEGRLTLSAEVMVALVLRDGHRIWCETLDATHAVAAGQRRGDEYVTRFSFTMDDADAAGLKGKDNWRKYPKAMLWARAVSGLVRMHFPDVTAGITYTPEEMGDEDRFTAHPATGVEPSVREGLAARIDALPDGRKASLRQEWAAFGLSPLSRLTVEEAVTADELIGKAEAIDVQEAPGAPETTGGTDTPTLPLEASTEPQDGAGEDAGPGSPADLPGDGPPAVGEAVNGRDTRSAEGAPPAPQTDTGHCNHCGGAIWCDDVGLWNHADDEDDHPGEPSPAGPEVDVDALYAAFHAPVADMAARLAIETEVHKLNATKVLQALREADLPISGTVSERKTRLIEHRSAGVRG